MFQILKRTGLIAALAVGALTLSTTAQARDRYRDRGDDGALAIGAGIIGLAVGAAVASNNDRYYDRPYAYNYGAPPPRYRGYPRDYYYDAYPRRAYRYDRRWDRGYDRRGYAGGWGGYRDRRGYRGW